MKNRPFTLLALTLLLMPIVFNIAAAQSSDDRSPLDALDNTELTDEEKDQIDTLLSPAFKVIRAVSYVLGVVVVLLGLYFGSMFLGGDPAKIKKAWMGLAMLLVGIAIIIGAPTIARFFT